MGFLIVIPFGFLGPREGWREARQWLRLHPHGLIHVAGSGAFDQTYQNSDMEDDVGRNGYFWSRSWYLLPGNLLSDIKDQNGHRRFSSPTLTYGA